MFNKLFSKPYTCCMELHCKFGCYFSIIHTENQQVDGFKKFFDDNGFLIGYNMFDEEWEENIQLEEIYKKLLLTYNFDPKNKNIMVVYKNHKKVYLPNRLYVPIPPRGIFVYDKSRLKVSF